MKVHTKAKFSLNLVVNSKQGSDCGLVGIAVASDSRGTLFESSHQLNFIMNIFTVNY